MEDNEYLKWETDYQNENGDTAFHIAISKDADIDILKALTEKGVNVNIKNHNGKTPFECINHGSWHTAINLLKLEKDFDLRDDDGNSFLHVLMDRVGDSVWGIRRSEDGELVFGHSEQEKMIETFWDYVLDHSDEFSVNLNLQDKYGCTPQHVAADYWPSTKSLEVMLSHFEHVDPFICDKTGSNFLHTYFMRDRRMYAPTFQERMLKGQLTYLPMQSIAELLNSQTSNKDTPLHTFIKEGQSKTLLDCKDILESGADPNISDFIGNTALHCIFKKYVGDFQEDFDELGHVSKFRDCSTDMVIRCFVKHGADVNAVNHRGESPLFLASHPEHINCLANLGANINLRNKLLQTPLIYFVGKENAAFETLENLLKQGADVYAADIHGSIVLHHIAWHGYHADILPALNKFKLKDKRDQLGHLPCDVAYKQGHKAIFDEICECIDDHHGNEEHFNLTRDVINLTALVKSPEEFQEKFDRIRNFRKEKISEMLTLPGIGVVNFDEETAVIMNVANEITKSICKKLVEKNDFWKCRIVQSGSVGEKTKVNSPNEFDFVVILENLGKICYIDEDQSGKDQGYAYLKLKEVHAAGEYARFLSDENYLDPEKVRCELIEILDELYITEVPFQHPYISFVEGDHKAVSSPTFNFKFYWNGCLYKNLLVDIDLVPACQVKKWWPDKCNKDGIEGDTEVWEEQGAILLLQTDLNADRYKLRISAMTAEKEHILHLPEVARDAYKICKIICDRRICPDLHVKKDVPAKKALTSYMLKNSMFHVMNDIKVSEQKKISRPSEQKKLKLNESAELHIFVLKIFYKLLEFARAENLPSFMFPWENVFTFNSKVFAQDNRAFCAFRYSVIKIILSMLGERQDFSDIDEVLCSLAVGDESENDEDSEESAHSNEKEDDDALSDMDYQTLRFKHPMEFRHYDLF